MSNPIIEVSGLSKQYRIGTKVTYKSLRETIMNVVASPARLLKGNESKENETKNIQKSSLSPFSSHFLFLLSEKFFCGYSYLNGGSLHKVGS
jgi:hypothetical protein